jgi:UDP-N-acetylmuramate--alanine ligase
MNEIPPRVHLVGVGGMHMSAIARILRTWGHQVSGSDLRASPLTEELKRLGVHVAIGEHRAANVGEAGLVVTTSAAAFANPELAEARRRGIPVIKRAEMVGLIIRRSGAGVCVAGTHGKSTTSGLIAHVLKESGRDPTYLVGAEVVGLGTNAAAGKGPHVVVEADEYDRAFLSYRPSVGVVLNVEPDHLDYYKTVEALVEAFRGFAGNVLPGGTLVLCADSPGALDLGAHAAPGVAVETYGLRQDLRLARDRRTGVGWVARLLGEEVEPAGRAVQRFEVLRYGAPFGEFSTALPGVHNVSNALAAIAALAALGLGAEEIAGPLGGYGGVRRRFEVVGEVDGILLLDDYAHHPTEVEAMVAAARGRFPGRRIVGLFQPHTYARTRYLLDDDPSGPGVRSGFRTCFRGFDRLFILETYAAREAMGEGITAAALAEAVESPPATYVATSEEAADAVAAELRPGDVFFTVGAGDVDAVGPLVLERLRRVRA